MPTVNRVVIGAKDKKGAVIYRNSSNHQEVPDVYWRSTLRANTERPVNNTIDGDRAADVTDREPLETALSSGPITSRRT